MRTNLPSVRRILTKIESGDIDAAICVVTLTEIYYKYMHEERLDLARNRTEDLMNAIYLEKLGIDGETAVRAGEFKGKYKVSVADAFIASTA